MSHGLNEVGCIAVGGVSDRIIAPLAEKLEPVVELKSVTEDLLDFKIIGGGGERDARLSLDTGWISGIVLDLIGIEIRMRLRISDIKLIRGAGLLVS